MDRLQYERLLIVATTAQKPLVMFIAKASILNVQLVLARFRHLHSTDCACQAKGKPARVESSSAIYDSRTRAHPARLLEAGCIVLETLPEWTQPQQSLKLLCGSAYAYGVEHVGPSAASDVLILWRLEHEVPPKRTFIARSLCNQVRRDPLPPECACSL